MNLGSLVKFSPPILDQHLKPIAVKHFKRLQLEINDMPGTIISKHGDNFCVLFGSKKLILNKNFLEVIHG